MILKFSIHLYAKMTEKDGLSNIARLRFFWLFSTKTIVAPVVFMKNSGFTLKIGNETHSFQWQLNMIKLKFLWFYCMLCINENAILSSWSPRQHAKGPQWALNRMNKQLKWHCYPNQDAFKGIEVLSLLQMLIQALKLGCLEVFATSAVVPR